MYVCMYVCHSVGLLTLFKLGSKFILSSAFALSEISQHKLTFLCGMVMVELN